MKDMMAGFTYVRTPARARALAQALTQEFWDILRPYFKAAVRLHSAYLANPSPATAAAFRKALDRGIFPAWALSDKAGGVFLKLSDKLSDKSKLTEKEAKNARNCK